MNPGLQSNEDITTQNITKNQYHEPLQSILKTKCDRAEDELEEKTEKSILIPVIPVKEKLEVPFQDFQNVKVEGISTNENTEQEQDDVKSLLLKAIISNSVREEHQESPSTDSNEVDFGREVKSNTNEVVESTKERDRGVLMGKKISRSKRRKTRVKSADLKLNSIKINSDEDRSKERIVLHERCMVKFVQDFGEGTENKIKYPRSNCRDIMSLLQQDNSDDLNLYPDWKRRRERRDFSMSQVNRDCEKPLPLPPISQAIKKRSVNTGSVIMEPDWTRAPVGDIILR